MPPVLSAKDAIRTHVKDGDTVYLAGFTHLIPFAMGHEIIRQGIRHLTLCRATPDLVYDQMIACGVADRLVFSYAGNPGIGNLPAFRRAVEEGSLLIDEYTHFELVARLAAGAAHVPFWPLLTLDNDLTRRRPRPRVKNPFGEGDVAVVSALNPDVTIVHAHAADEHGNIYAWGLLGEMKEAVLAAGRVVASVEEIRPAAALRQERDHLLVPGFRVASLSVIPMGAHPSYALGVYDRDTEFYAAWDALARNEDALRAWLDTHVYGVPDRAGYLDLFGSDRLLHLRELAHRAL